MFFPFCHSKTEMLTAFTDPTTDHSTNPNVTSTSSTGKLSVCVQQHKMILPNRHPRPLHHWNRSWSQQLYIHRRSDIVSGCHSQRSFCHF